MNDSRRECPDCGDVMMQQDDDGAYECTGCGLEVSDDPDGEIEMLAEIEEYGAEVLEEIEK